MYKIKEELKNNIGAGRNRIEPISWWKEVYGDEIFTSLERASNMEIMRVKSSEIIDHARKYTLSDWEVVDKIIKLNEKYG